MQFGHLLFSFNGRITRSQYWLGWLATTIGGGVLIAAALIMTIGDGKGGGNLLMLALLALPILGLIAWCGLAVQVKRFHDRGRSGWFSALPFAISFVSMIATLAAASAGDPMAGAGILLPMTGLGGIVNIWLFIELGFLPGTDGPNKYDGTSGPRPSPFAPSKRMQDPAPAALSLDGAHAAMERAIADRETGKAPASHAAPRQELRPAFAGGAPGGAAPSFGRRSAR